MERRRSGSSAQAGSDSPRRPASRSSVMTSSSATSRRERIAALKAGEVPIHEPGLEGARAESRSSTSRRPATSSGRPGSSSSASARRPRIPATPTLCGLAHRRRARGGRGAPAARHEKHRSRRDRREGAARARRTRACAHWLRREPRVPRGRDGRADFNEPDRVVVGAFAHEDGEASWRLLRAAQGAHRAQRTSPRPR